MNIIPRIAMAGWVLDMEPGGFARSAQLPSLKNHTQGGSHALR